MIAKLNLTKNISLKILSLLFAIVVWLIVVNISDPVTTKRFRKVPVTIENAEFLSQEGMVYQVEGGTDVVDITVRAKRSVLKEIDAEDFEVTADMRELVYMQSIRINVSCEEHEDQIEELLQSRDTVLVSVEKRGEKTLSLQLETEGTPAEGYTVGRYYIDPAEITVSGPDSVIKKIDKAVLKVNVDSLQWDISTVLSPVLYNTQGEVITNERLTFSTVSWNVVVPIWETKSVAIQAVTSGEPAPGYSLDEVVCYPTALTVTGKKENLRELSEIEIPEGVLVIEGATQNVKQKVDIEQYLPEGIYLVEEDITQVEVEAKIQKQTTRAFTIAVDEIGLRNAPEDLKVSFAEVTQYSVELRGTKKELDELQITDIKCTVNLSGLPVGQHQVPLEIVVSGDAEVVGDHVITVYLSEKGTSASQNGTQNTMENENQNTTQNTEE